MEKKIQRTHSKELGEGVILGSEYGCPDGCTQVSAVREKSAALLTKLYNSEAALRDGQGEDVWKAAQKKASLAGLVTMRVRYRVLAAKYNGPNWLKPNIV